MSTPRTRRAPARLGRWFGHALLGACALWSGTAGARPLDEMIASHHFSVCAADNALPYSRNDADTPGFYLEIAAEIAKALGLELEVVWLASSEQIRFTACDAVMAAPAPAEGREREREDGDQDKLRPRLLTMPYMQVNTLLVYPRQPAGTPSIAALRRGHVAVPSGSVAHQLLNEAGVPVWVRFRNDAEILEAVRAGQADAGVVSQIGYGWYRRNNPASALVGVADVLEAPGLRFDVAIALRRTNLATLRRIDAIIRQLRDDGVIPAILAKYGIDSRTALRRHMGVSARSRRAISGSAS
jgi:polar amino acid transport system substrate-binding protein